VNHLGFTCEPLCFGRELLDDLSTLQLPKVFYFEHVLEDDPREAAPDGPADRPILLTTRKEMAELDAL